MSKAVRPVFYKPTFGNDNALFSAGALEAVDVAAFRSPYLRHADAALAPVEPAGEPIVRTNG